MAKSLVIGASGLVGGYILQHLIDRGETPFALSRSSRTNSGSVEWFEGNLLDPAAIDIPPFTTLYCTALAEQLVLALPRLINPALKRIVVITSTSIVTKIDSEIPAERELLRRYADSERRLADICEQSGIEWTILRPTVIYAEGHDANITRIAGLIKKWGFIPLAGSGKGLRQPVHAEDVAIGAVDAAASATAANRIYAIPGGETISYREMVGRIFDGMRRPRRIISIAPVIWRVGFFILNRWLPNANSAMGTRMSNDMVFDSAPARNEFGWDPRPFRPRFD
ncbi:MULTISPECIES: NAD-dependent epimerase/dehydratase family protein [Bradyrhizobium]|uniref:Nucleoside-diphosphate-sugar epimerase n=2 Tax=Bradyrhizobium TaxID=374 RepID=A0ABY0Q8U1_9BRAD|nr:MULTISPECIES: NAD-dependent epimerase/dehydratase family protein [Bradyrhizobium]SDJ71267.1 Nucleoside-diphosphate-sugar epimerase [Bradyrhizobium ottawaense]SEC22280.1 Nucleoside-diphosphate-sugar epimerase [Bradyrhizobium lablabi]